MKKRVAIFISDDGFGHLVRQRVLINEMLKLKKQIDITVSTRNKLKYLKKDFANKINYHKNFNNIVTIKKKDGSLDKKKTNKIFENWLDNYPKWIERNIKKYKNFDFIISDFVPEAFLLANKLKIPCIGVAHFTWDWFLKKIGTSKKKNIIYSEMKYMINLADKIFLPPFTPKKILYTYKHKIKKINFIVSKFDKKKTKNKKISVLLLNNGGGNLNNAISNTIPFLPKVKNIIFTIRTDNLSLKNKDLIKKNKNLKSIEGLKETHNQINSSDIIVARGGFNTISECLSLKKTTMLFNEKYNPEVNENISALKKRKLTSLININNCGVNFKKTLDLYIKSKRKIILKNLKKFDFKSNGEKEIASYIKENLNLYSNVK